MIYLRTSTSWTVQNGTRKKNFLSHLAWSQNSKKDKFSSTFRTVLNTSQISVNSHHKGFRFFGSTIGISQKLLINMSIGASLSLSLLEAVTGKITPASQVSCAGFLIPVYGRSLSSFPTCLILVSSSSQNIPLVYLKRTK